MPFWLPWIVQRTCRQTRCCCSICPNCLLRAEIVIGWTLGASNIALATAAFFMNLRDTSDQGDNFDVTRMTVVILTAQLHAFAVTVMTVKALSNMPMPAHANEEAEEPHRSTPHDDDDDEPNGEHDSKFCIDEEETEEREDDKKQSTPKAESQSSECPDSQQIEATEAMQEKSHAVTIVELSTSTDVSNSPAHVSEKPRASEPVDGLNRHRFHKMNTIPPPPSRVPSSIATRSSSTSNSRRSVHKRALSSSSTTTPSSNRSSNRVAKPHREFERRNEIG